MPEKLNAFLWQYGMHADRVSPYDCLTEFIAEMHAGLAGEPGATLSMLPTWLPAGFGPGGARPQGTAIVLDAGGTHLRVGVVTLGLGQTPQVRQLARHPMPGTRERLSRSDFFDRLARHLLPVASQSSHIGFCFSHAAEAQPDLDGRVLNVSKELAVDDLEGALLGKELCDALVRLGSARKRCIVLNDTAAVLLGVAACSQADAPGAYAGFVLGTGTNSCYGEKPEHLPGTATHRPHGEIIVNLESGGYGKFPRGEIDRRVDAATQYPGDHLFEKMIGGAYHGLVIAETVRAAAAEGLFSPGFAEGFGQIGALSLRELERFCEAPHSGALANLCAAPTDRELLLGVIHNSYERAARMIAVNLAALIVKSGHGKAADDPLYIAMEGSAFRESRLLRARLEQHRSGWIAGDLGLHCRLIDAPENAALIGAAAAAAASRR